MKNTFQKLFRKKGEFTESAFEKCSRSELLEMIMKLDSDLGDASSNLEIVNQSKSVLKRELEKTKEELKLYKEHSERMQGETNSLQQEIESQRTEITSHLSEIEELKAALELPSERIKELEQQLEELSELKEEIIGTREKLQNSEEKRRKIKKELENALKPKPMPKVSIRNIAQSDVEHKALAIIKEQINLLYKELMQLMMNAKTIKSPESIYYQITVNDFSLFEKDFNQIMMSVHEAAENPKLVTESDGWIQRFSTMVQPYKLFSCMTQQSQRQTHPRQSLNHSRH